ncbi:hypothetical protein Celaphus_00012211 [Cervus elaphus hippelaphus]|uniref:Uncharacterized protein n=1 Tax=Cervus elaphus hippelaphus TaxID=46360 RepID=A0A212CL69_CEREH|nr:hypothetical protein Celaphus_00012211 [Cervus elaphus hippelaphus]
MGCVIQYGLLALMCAQTLSFLDLSKERLDSACMPEQLVGQPKQVGGGCEWGWAKMAVPVVQAVENAKYEMQYDNKYYKTFYNMSESQKDMLMGLPFPGDTGFKFTSTSSNNQDSTSSLGSCRPRSPAPAEERGDGSPWSQRLHAWLVANSTGEQGTHIRQ